MHKIGPKRSRSGCQGAVLIETAVGLAILCVIVFGIAEIGWSFRDASTVNTFARDYARDLSRGMTVASARTYIRSNNTIGSSALLQNGLSDDTDFVAYYSTDGGVTFPTSHPVGDDTSGAKNNVPVGDLIKVTITYSHSRLTGLFGNGRVPMQAVAIMVRQ